MTERLIALIDQLCGNVGEAEWYEFKQNNADPEMIAKLISATANSACLHGKPNGYILWGVQDGTHAVVGTTFSPITAKKGNQDLQLWLSNQLQPTPIFQFHEVAHSGGKVVILQIAAANRTSVKFGGIAYIRINSATPRLGDHPAKEEALNSKLNSFAWESGVAKAYITADEVLRLLDYPGYFRLTEQALPANQAAILSALHAERLISQDVGDRWDILNLGAVLFANQLREFDVSMARKALRMIKYNGVDRAANTTREDGSKGYASGFEELLRVLNAWVPNNELIEQALRQEHSMYPAIALRELVANALIHQDMTVTGAGPMIEVFSNRIEITNPGEPLIPIDRFINHPPRSRNEALAALMRRMRMCEEQGTGIDKVITAVEEYQLPPIDIVAEGNNLRVTLYAHRTFAGMTKAERVRACFQHAMLRQVVGEKLTNESLRTRFGIEKKNAAQVTRVINEALKEGQIKPADPESPRSGYVPHWGI